MGPQHTILPPQGPHEAELGTYSPKGHRSVCPHASPSGALFLAPWAEAASLPSVLQTECFLEPGTGAAGASRYWEKRTLSPSAPAGCKGTGTDGFVLGCVDSPEEHFGLSRVLFYFQDLFQGPASERAPQTSHPKTLQRAGKETCALGPGLEGFGRRGRAGGGSLPPTAPASVPLMMEPQLCTVGSSLEQKLTLRPPTLLICTAARSGGEAFLTSLGADRTSRGSGSGFWHHCGV